MMRTRTSFPCSRKASGWPGKGRAVSGSSPAVRPRHNVNLSGGMLNGNPIMLGGVARAVEGYLQLRGEAGDRQVDGAKRALAHGTTGGACQHQTVLILEK